MRRRVAWTIRRGDSTGTLRTGPLPADVAEHMAGNLPKMRLGVVRAWTEPEDMPGKGRRLDLLSQRRNA